MWKWVSGVRCGEDERWVIALDQKWGRTIKGRGSSSPGTTFPIELCHVAEGLFPIPIMLSFASKDKDQYTCQNMAHRVVYANEGETSNHYRAEEELNQAGDIDTQIATSEFSVYATRTFIARTTATLIEP